MIQVKLRPDMRTAGGEVDDILVDGNYAGTLSLVYREGSRLSGSLQLDKESLPHREKQSVIRFVDDYVESLVEALQVPECDVIVTYSQYDHIIASEQNVGVIREFVDEEEENRYAGSRRMVSGQSDPDFDYDYVDPESGLGDYDDAEADVYEMEDEASPEALRPTLYELVLVSQGEQSVDYQIYDADQRLVAEAAFVLYGPDIVGEVLWKFEPAEDEIEAMTDLLVSDFDEDEADTFVIHMKYRGDVLETIELTHEDLLAMEDENGESEDFSVALMRDDEDTLTYEIYKASMGGMPIGTATLDISRRAVSGIIDFEIKGSDEDRERVAELLMQELDKERDFDSFSITMLHRNIPFEEMIFEQEMFH